VPPPVGERAVDIDALARDVARDLRVRYGERLAEVLVFGSHARGDAGEESDLDLLVLLVGPVDPWEELRRIDDVLWHHSQLSGVTVSAFPVSDADFAAPTTPVLIRARAEARQVA
jgi:predicted nucleotidyltransferase